MSQREKAWRHFNSKPTPNDITFEEVETLAESFGCTVKYGGKHPKVVHKPSGTVIPVPRHGKYIGEAYINQLKALFCSIQEGKWS